MYLSVKFAGCKQIKLPRKDASLFTNVRNHLAWTKPFTRTDRRIVLYFISMHNIANTPNHIMGSTYPLNSTLTGIQPWAQGRRFADSQTKLFDSLKAAWLPHERWSRFREIFAFGSRRLVYYNVVLLRYSRLSLNGHLYKTNTSVKRTPRVGPCLWLFLVFDSL